MNGLFARLVLLFSLLLVTLLPAVGYGLILIVERNLEDAFITHVRTYSRLLADAIEQSWVDSSNGEIEPILDSALLNGGAVFVQLEIAGRILNSSLNEIESMGEQDFSIGQHADSVYYLSTAIAGEAAEGNLRIGFDESAVRADIADAQRRIIVLLGLFFFTSLVILAIFSRWLSRPLQALRDESRNIADGNWDRRLTAHSSIREIDALAMDLERMRAALVSANQKLAREIEQRREEVEKRAEVEAQLRHAQKIESIGTLAGGMAHEFNNLLLPMLINIELLMEEFPENRAAQEDLQKVLSSIHRAKELTKRILEFSRQTGTEKLMPIEVNKVVEDAIGWLRAVIPANVSIEIHSSERLLVLMDASQLHQVMVNLCNNAVQAMSADGGLLSISVWEDAREQVAIEVADSGEGMSPELQSRIFEPFFTTRNVGVGTGLGLSVVHGIVTGSGGRIGLSSSVGGGTRIVLRLPKYDEKAVISEVND